VDATPDAALAGPRLFWKIGPMNPTARRLCWVGSALLATSVGCKAAPQIAADRPLQSPPVRVGFAPAPKEELRERSITTRTEGEGGAQRAEAVTAELTSRFDPEGDGWVLTQQVTQVAVRSGGVEVQSPLAELVTRFPLKLRLAKDGDFIRLLNPQDARRAVEETFSDPQQAEAVLAYFTPEALEAQARREWTARYGALFERNLEVGTALYAVESFVTSFGKEVSYLVERLVIEAPSDGGARRVRLALSCPVDPAQAKSQPQAEAALEASGRPALEPTVRCVGEQQLELAPFSPSLTTFELTAAPQDEQGSQVPITLSRRSERLALDDRR
jgi:hypothetical protein